MSQESQIFIAENFYNFKEKLVDFFKQFDTKEKHITKADVEKFFSDLNDEKERSLIEHMAI